MRSIQGEQMEQHRPLGGNANAAPLSNDRRQNPPRPVPLGTAMTAFAASQHADFTLEEVAHEGEGEEEVAVSSDGGRNNRRGGRGGRGRTATTRGQVISHTMGMRNQQAASIGAQIGALVQGAADTPRGVSDVISDFGKLLKMKREYQNDLDSEDNEFLDLARSALTFEMRGHARAGSAEEGEEETEGNDSNE